MERERKLNVGLVSAVNARDIREEDGGDIFKKFIFFVRVFLRQRVPGNCYALVRKIK